MSAIFLLFRRRLFYVTRWALLVTGYDAKRRDLSEQLYGVYALALLGLWVVLMLSWSVVNIAQVIEHVKEAHDFDYRNAIFFGLAAWIVVTPWLAQRSYNLYRFSLADYDFLGTSPIDKGAIAGAWFGKSLFTRVSALFVAGCGLLGGALSTVAKANDWLGLIVGFLAGGLFFVAVSALLWLLGLLRYRPTPAFNPLLGYGLTALGIALLVLPQTRVLFWPANLTASLVTGQAESIDEVMPGLLGLALTVLAGVVGLVLVARTTLLAPAFEEGRQRRQIKRLKTKARATPATELAPTITQTGRLALTGVGGSLVLKEWLRFGRLPIEQRLLRGVGPIVVGAATALSISVLSHTALRVEVLAPATFLANFVLIRQGMSTLLNDLGYLDFYVGWPLSRLRMMIYDVALGFALPTLSGEVALLAAGFAGADWVVIGLWLALWPMLMAASALASLLELQFTLRKWPATRDTLPESNGPLVVLLAGLVWLAAVLFGPAVGVMVAFMALMLGAMAMVSIDAVR